MITRLNTLRQQFRGETFTKTAMVSKFKENKITYPDFVFNFLRKQDCIERLGHSEFRFQEEPILKSVLDEGIRQARIYFNPKKKDLRIEETSVEAPKEQYTTEEFEQMLANARKEFAKFPSVREEPVVEKQVEYKPTAFQLTEEESINFLKQRGYKIFKYQEV